MKRKTFCTVYSLLFFVFQIYAEKTINYCEFTEIENINNVIVTKRKLNENQQDIAIRLNEKQQKEFLDRIKILKQQKYIKVLLKYEVSIFYDNNKTNIFFINGRVIKKQDGTTYIIDNNITLFLNSLFTKDDVSNNYKEKIIETQNRRILVYQANYSRKDLVHINGVTSNANPAGVYDLTWKIGRELIDAQDSFFKKKYLKNYIEREKLKEIADLYINEIYKPDNPLIYSYYELHPLDEKKEKWIIYFIYVIKEHRGKRKYWDEVVFMLPDGTIVISDNNYEHIQF